MAEPWTILTKQVPWYGRATGYYGCLPEAFVQRGLDCRVVSPRPGWMVRLAGKLWSWRHGLPARHQSLAFAEREFLQRFDETATPGLLLAIEDNLPLLSLARFRAGAPARLIGVIHYPRALWTEPMLAALARLRSALVLYRADIEFFERHVGAGRVAFVPHGVDTTHFTPAADHPGGPPQLLVSGQFGRDFRLLAEVFPAVRARVPDCRLDVVGAHHVRFDPELRALAAMPGVTVHGRRSDAELLAHYRHATLALLPLRAAGANNALVEALACGCPILASDVGGVRDYGGGTVFPVVPPGDAPAMIAAAETLLRDPAQRRALGHAARRYAEQHLSWSRSAEQHLVALSSLGVRPAALPE